jgi:hypothetical protein
MRNVDETVNKCTGKVSRVAFTSWGYEINFDRIGDMVERHFCSASIFTIIPQNSSAVSKKMCFWLQYNTLGSV